jgi:hypothetical protein
MERFGSVTIIDSLCLLCNHPRGTGEIRSVQGHDKLTSPERALISVASPWARGGHIPISKSKSGLTVSLVAAARHGSIFPILKERASALSQ